MDREMMKKGMEDFEKKLEKPQRDDSPSAATGSVTRRVGVAKRDIKAGETIRVQVLRWRHGRT